MYDEENTNILKKIKGVIQNLRIFSKIPNELKLIIDNEYGEGKILNILTNLKMKLDKLNIYRLEIKEELSIKELNRLQEVCLVEFNKLHKSYHNEIFKSMFPSWVNECDILYEIHLIRRYIVHLSYIGPMERKIICVSINLIILKIKILRKLRDDKMKKSIDNNVELQKFKNESKSNLKIYEGKPGCGKSFSAKDEINQLSLMENINIYVIDHEDEYKKLSRENVIISNDKEKLFEILDDIYEKSGKLKINQKTIVYIDGFESYCRDKEKQIKFLEYAEKLKGHGISFVLILQDLDFMNTLIRNMYLLYCDEHYEFNRD